MRVRRPMEQPVAELVGEKARERDDSDGDKRMNARRAWRTEQRDHSLGHTLRNPGLREVRPAQKRAEHHGLKHEEDGVGAGRWVEEQANGKGEAQQRPQAQAPPARQAPPDDEGDADNSRAEQGGEGKARAG